jgi:DNA replication protein DnaC
MIKITKAVRDNGEFNLSKAGINVLDDVGTETVSVKHYGTEIRWFKDFVEETYLEVKDYSNFIISSNNNFSEMEEMYGFRASRRIKAMFNVVNVVDFR